MLVQDEILLYDKQSNKSKNDEYERLDKKILDKQEFQVVMDGL